MFNRSAPLLVIPSLAHRRNMSVIRTAVFIIAAFAIDVSFGEHDVCAGAACKSECECQTKNCDVATCLMDDECGATFACSVSKCPCGSGDSPCIKKCGGDLPSAVTNATMGCFFRKCRPSSFNVLAKSITTSGGDGPCLP